MGEAQKGMTFKRMVADLRRTFRGAFDGYRPELHYMRGPGPKWREKHAVAPQVEPTLPGTVHLPV